MNVGTLPIEDRINPAESKLAIAETSVMEQVERLEKADDNTFAKYKFTSVDDFKDHLRPLLAAAGLTVGMNQTACAMFQHTDGKGKETTHFRYDFELWLTHESGEVGEREATTVCLPFVGAQTNGIARSYALKEWLKSKFLASSGDISEDADHEVGELSKAEARDIFERLSSTLREVGHSGTEDDLKRWTADNNVLLASMPSDWKIHLRQEYSHAQLNIQDRANMAEIDANLPPDIDAWLSNLDDQMAGTDNDDDLNEVWLQAEDIGHALKRAGDERAINLLHEHQKRVKQ